MNDVFYSKIFSFPHIFLDQRKERWKRAMDSFIAFRRRVVQLSVVSGLVSPLILRVQPWPSCQPTSPSFDP
jgi:hypothetical protein